MLSWFGSCPIRLLGAGKSANQVLSWSRSLQSDVCEVGIQLMRCFRGLDAIQSDFHEVESQPIRFFRGLDRVKSNAFVI